VKRKWYSINLVSLLKAFFYIGLPFYYLLPLALVTLSMATGHTVYVNTKPVCLIVYDENMIQGYAAAGARGYVVYVRPELYDEPMVHAHEYKHIDQYWESLGLTKFTYVLSRRHRMLAEYEAYLEELKISDDLEYDTMRVAVAFSSPHYDLNISPELAYLLFQNGINKYRGEKQNAAF
jgi:hypothetical protein